MRIALAVGDDAAVVSGLAESRELVIHDDALGTLDRVTSPAMTVERGRRLAVVDTLLAREVDVVVAVPRGFCGVSHAVARAAGMRFLLVEPRTPLELLLEHLPALLATSQPEVPLGWLDMPAGAEATATTEVRLSDTAAHALGNRLRRLEGQARGVRRLIEERAAIDDVLTQVAAMRAAMNAIGLALLAENLAGCIAGADEPDGPARIEAAKRAFQRLG